MVELSVPASSAAAASGTEQPAALCALLNTVINAMKDWMKSVREYDALGIHLDNAKGSRLKTPLRFHLYDPATYQSMFVDDIPLSSKVGIWEWGLGIR
ncbi:MAG: hypothetical protein EOO40_10500 [Deltaproteobacteria bacterium]|nr:MAG: hypothetical protein EOO40_10500 [Deltaproteobacteria bacterium]